jgi:glutamate synthase (NADPH/NADH) small chain
VTIYDKNKLPGGLNTHGIAAYKTRARDAVREAEMVKRLGVRFEQEVEVGKDAPFPVLETEYDAIFIGVGLGETWDLQIPGAELRGVYGAMEFIEQTKLKSFVEVEVGRRVACIGAGNTAIDVMTAARRLGAESVHLLYRRGEDEMSAFPYEHEIAQHDGVEFHWNTQPVRILGEGGAVTAVECVRTRTHMEGEAHGKSRAPEVIPGSEFTIPVDMVVRAIGQKPVTEFLRAVKGIELRKDGTIAVNESNQTGNPKYFAGGDCVNGGREVVDAVAEGMAAARGLDAWLGKPRGKK